MKLPIPMDMLLHGKAVEWERLEFKAGWNPLDVLHTLCAFANDFHNLGGGYIVVGVAEHDGRPALPPVGVDISQLNAIQKEILIRLRRGPHLFHGTPACAPSSDHAGGTDGATCSSPCAGRGA